MSFEIKMFVKNATTKAAFETNSEFYGAGSIGKPFSVTGYPNAAGTQAGNISLTPHEITAVEEGGTTLVINGDPTPSSTVTIGDTILDVSFEGAYIWDATDPENPTLLCVVDTYVNSTTFTADRTFDTDISLTNFFYQKSGVANFQGFLPNENFYLLIKTNDAASATSGFPQIKGVSTSFNSSTQIGEADNSFITVERISSPGIPGSIIMTPEDVPCTIKRVNKFVAGNTTDTYFKTNQDKPFWVCWEVNPYGTASTSLSNKTLYQVEAIENLPSTDTSINFTYSSAEAGWI